MKLYTIGYSGFPKLSEFIKKLTENNINTIYDVRSSPFSAQFSQYNDNSYEFAKALNDAGIKRINFSREFGARQENRKFYKNGRLDFEIFTQSPQFKEGFEKVFKGLESNSSVLLCAEKHPIDCHRCIMVARKFYEAGADVVHLMPDGEQTQADVEMELLDIYFPNRYQASLFEEQKSEEEMISEAYILQNDKIGFKEVNLR